MRKILFFLVFILLLTSCFAEQREIEGLTDEIYNQCSGIWTMEKYYKNVQTVGMQTSWGRALGGQRGFSILIDLRSKKDIDIWPDMGALVVKKVEMIDEKTIRMFVNKFSVSSKIQIEEFKPLTDFSIIFYFLDKHRVWIDSKVNSSEESSGSLIYHTGPDYIYKKVSGPDMEPPFTEKPDDK